MTDVSGCIHNIHKLFLTLSPRYQSHKPQREPPIENELEASALLRASGRASLAYLEANTLISFSPFKTDPSCVLKDTAFHIIHCFHHLLFCAHEIFIQYKVSVSAGKIWSELRGDSLF